MGRPSAIGRDVRLRIAMTTDSYLPSPGGVVTAVVNAKKALESKGHEVIVIAPDPGKEELREEGTVYFPAWECRPYPGYYVPIFPSNKMQIIRELDVDLIHSQGQLIMGMRGLVVSRSLNLPFVVSFNTMMTEALKYYSPFNLDSNVTENLIWFYFRTLLHNADAVITLTDAIGEELRRRAPRIRRLETIPVGIDTDHFNPAVDASDLRRRLGLEDRRVLVHVGRMSYEKNIELVVRAMAHTDDDVALVLVGSGPAEGKLKNMVRSMGLQDRVVFTGYVPLEDLRRYYAAADASVIASKFETQGLVVNEAMACGLPVAAINYRALKEAVSHGHNGYLFEDDARSCAEAMGACLDAPASLRANARRTAESYSIDANTERLISLYEYAIESNAERQRGGYYRRLQNIYNSISPLR